jgi:hypothetical protein
MKVPANTRLPFFAYGLFKPGQLCFFRIKDLVIGASDAEVEGYLKERDGIPLLIPGSGFTVKGVLIEFLPAREVEGYTRIVEIESDEVYKWQEVRTSSGIQANALVGKRVDRGSSDLEYVQEWDSRSDPFFQSALEVIETILRQNAEFTSDFKALLRLQMAYSLLWTAIERYAGLRYHLGKGVMEEKIKQIGKEDAFGRSLKKHVKHGRTVYSTADLGKYTLDPNDPGKSILYYYQVRSNAVHRGKAVFRDFDILNDSLSELLRIFKDILEEAWGSGEAGKVPPLPKRVK